MSSITIKLISPIQAHGKTVTELELAEPRGTTIRTCGMPFKIDEKSGISFDTEVLCRYISALAQIPSSSVDQLSAPDFNNIQTRIVSFFVDAIPPNASIDTGNSPVTSQG